MSRYIDISVPLDAKLPIWPGSPGFKLSRLQSIKEGDTANVSQLCCELHTGTHIDAPSHFLKEGKSVEELPLELMIGPVWLADFRGLTTIDKESIKERDIPDECRRILFLTDNSVLWKRKIKAFQEDFVALTAEAATLLVERGIDVVGIDYLSIQRFNDGPQVHQILLDSEVLIIEGLNLSGLAEGWYKLFCLPIRLVGTEAAPARVILQEISN